MPRSTRPAAISFTFSTTIQAPNPETCVARWLISRTRKVQMVGGPNVCPREAPPLEQVFALVLASWVAFGPSRARYAAVGRVRETSEKELILCNLLARRQAMLELGGFNEALYPNEENALMDELQKRGGKLIYDPELLVHRRPRSSLKSFARMLMTYGRGRAEQFRLHPTLGSALNFVASALLPVSAGAASSAGADSHWEALSGAAAVLCPGRAGAGGGARGWGASAPEPRRHSPDRADAYSVWPGLLARTIHAAAAAWTASAGPSRAGDRPALTGCHWE